MKYQRKSGGFKSALKQMGFIGFHPGRRCIDGSTNGSGSDPVPSILYDFEEQPTLVSQRGGYPLTLVRGTTATQTDQDLIIRSDAVSQARMQGFRVVENLLNKVTGANSTTLAGATLDGATITGPDSDGYYTCTRTALGGNYAQVAFTSPAATYNMAGRRYRLTADFKSSGTLSNLLLKVSDVTTSTQVVDITSAITAGGVRLTGLFTGFVTNSGFIGCGLGFGANADSVKMRNIQIEDVTGQVDQNPAEYVSVGVLSAPFHGLGIDGVKAFATLNGNTVTSNVVTEPTGLLFWGALPGVAGSYFSTPDSAANSITGDIDIRCQVALVDWTPASPNVLVAKYDGASQRAYALRVNATGNLDLFWSSTGGADLSAVSTVVTGVTDGTVKWVRATLDVDNGASGRTVTFYLSDDGVAWTILGSAVTTAGVTSIFNSSAILEVGSFVSGVTQLLTGKIYRAQIYNGIDGTLAVDFNPRSWVSGPTWPSATTSEVWTIQGTSYIANDVVGALIAGNSYFGSLPGTSGAYFSTPDSVAASVTGDIDIRVKVAMDDWTPSATMTFISKSTGGDPNRAWEFSLDTTGILFFNWYPLGTSASVISKAATSAVSITNGTVKFVRVTLDVDNGAAGNSVAFYTSDDGATWTQVGTTVVTAGVTSLPDTNSVVSVGARASAADFLAGKIYRVQILNGIAGTLAVDFNPNSWVSGATWTSATTEVWTINGTASVITNPKQGLLVEPAATNLCLQSETFDNASWTKDGVTISANAIAAPDGLTSADKLVETATTALHRITQTTTNAVATYTCSGYFKAAERTKAFLVMSDNATAGIGSLIDLSAGTVSADTAAVGSWTNISRSIQALQGGWYRVTITGTRGAGTQTLVIAYASDGSSTSSSSTYLGDITKGVYAWGLELKTGASTTDSYIPTATVAVTRNASVVSRTLGGEYNPTAGTLYVDFIQPVNDSDYRTALSLDGATSADAIIIYARSGLNRAEIYVGGVLKFAANLAAPVAGTRVRIAFAWAINDGVAYQNNVAMTVTTAGTTLPTVTKFVVGGQQTVQQLGSTIAEATYYPRRLSNIQTQALTTA